MCTTTQVYSTVARSVSHGEALEPRLVCECATRSMTSLISTARPGPSPTRRSWPRRDDQVASSTLTSKSPTPTGLTERAAGPHPEPNITPSPRPGATHLGSRSHRLGRAFTAWVALSPLGSRSHRCGVVQRCGRGGDEATGSDDIAMATTKPRDRCQLAWDWRRDARVKRTRPLPFECSVCTAESALPALVTRTASPTRANPANPRVAFESRTRGTHPGSVEAVQGARLGRWPLRALGTLSFPRAR
jgi:hypothetical protein